MSEDRRCPSCGALVAPDAEWCGQCYASLRVERTEPEPMPPPPERETPPAERAAVATPGGGGVEVARGRASWDCAVCGERNPFEASVCGVCQTPFARLFELPEERRPQIEPRTAALWSLAFAGLGHWKAGYRADGFARIVLFVWTLGTVIVVLLSRSEEGLGQGAALFGLYLGAALAIYVLSAMDAYRLADGRAPLVTSRVLLWASAALVLASIVLATFITLPAARG